MAPVDNCLRWYRDIHWGLMPDFQPNSMRTIIDFYDRIYLGLCNGLFANSKVSEKFTSVLAVISIVEWLYFLDLVILINKITHASDIHWGTFKPRVLLVGLGVCALNMAYMYPRRTLLEKRSSEASVPDKYSS